MKSPSAQTYCTTDAGRAADRLRIGSDLKMTSRKSVGLILAAALVAGAGVLYWAHTRSGRSARALASTSESPGSDLRPIEAAASYPNSAANSYAPSAARSRAVDPGFPRVGEILEFIADVSKLNNVANLRLQVAERRNFFGKSAWHLQAFAHTENPLRYVFELDDQFDSYSDAATLSSLQYEMHLRERGEKVDSVQRMTTTGKDPAPPNATETRVPPGTRDPLGLMQYLRSVDWPKVHEMRSSVYDGHKLYDVRASSAGAPVPVEVPAGKYTASKIEIHVFEGGTELSDARFALYLANNPARTPVLLEAVMPFAAARVQLSKAK
jgi:Protein of unknown function (DUF3108)